MNRYKNNFYIAKKGEEGGRYKDLKVCAETAAKDSSDTLIICSKIQ